MSIPSTLTLLNVIGILAAFAALTLIAYTYYTVLQAHPKQLKQQIQDTKPKPPPKPIPMKRIVDVTVSEEITEKLESYFTVDQLNPGWNRT